MSKLKLTCWLLISVLLAIGVAVVAWRAKLFGTTYTAKAVLQLAPFQPHILPHAAEKYDPVEFEMSRDTQAALIRTERVIIAALREPGLNKLYCIQRADERHDAIRWLTDAIHVNFPVKNSGVIYVSATEPADINDPSLPPGKPAAALVNAVVKAYMDVIVDAERLKRKKRLDDLQKIHIEKEVEVRAKREQLKRELEQLGASDDQSMATRTQLTVNMYAELQREFQRMKSEQRAIVGKHQETKQALEEMQADTTGSEIPELEVVSLLNGDPVYRDLRSRLAILEANRLHTNAAAPGTKQPPGPNQAQAEFEGTQAQLEKLQAQTRKMVRDAKLIALNQEKRRLENEVDISRTQIALFEKEVDKKKEEADNAGRITISAQMAKVHIENIERVLRNVAEEEERLRVELTSASRVTELPAELPESPD
ncbi:MAG: hypothetical protein ABSG53_19835 [Thermoguttaceae bacterium]|jgi:predicted  nucleic acid-binding Zn-ribbon protein